MAIIFNSEDHKFWFGRREVKGPTGVDYVLVDRTKLMLVEGRLEKTLGWGRSKGTLGILEEGWVFFS